MTALLLGAVLAACPSKLPAWGQGGVAPVPRHSATVQVRADSSCRVYVATRQPPAVVRLDASGAPSADFASNGVLSLGQPPEQFVIDEARDRLVVLSTSNRPDATAVELRAFSLDGVPKRAFGQSGVAHLEGKRLHPTTSTTSGFGRFVVFDDGSSLVVIQAASALGDESAVYAFRLPIEGVVTLTSMVPAFVTQGLAGGTPQLARVGSSGAWFFTSSGRSSVLTRFDAQARLDVDLGLKGVLSVPDVVYASSLVPDDDGVLLGGTAVGYRQIIERRTAVGELDRAFGSSGQRVYKADGPRLEHVRDLLVTKTRVISLIAAYDHHTNTSKAAIEFWSKTGHLDPTFGAGTGVVWLPASAPVVDVVSATVDPAGRSLLAVNAGASSSILWVDERALKRAAAPRTRNAVRGDELWEYVDATGLTNYVNAREAIPDEYRSQARRVSLDSDER